MELYTLILFVIFATFKLGEFSGYVKSKRKLNDILKSSEVQIRIENIGGILYVYDNVTNAFIIQGETFVDVINKLQKDFPLKTFICQRENIEKVTGVQS